MAQLDLTNHFLIAMPTLMDPNFHQTVTYICAHNEEGAMGIVINRRMAIGLGEVLSQMELAPATNAIRDCPVFEGGPVQPDRGFILHRPTHDWGSTIEVTGEIGVSTSRDILEAIAHGQGPQDMLIALGYAGWGAGQLEREIAENAWLSGPADPDIMFRTAPEARWRAAARVLGVDLASISHQVGHA
ncbi:MAG: YqgE/AlgH family protein [Gammaproteobacteria bacterium]|nr:YqgE/AlgH family protein [Gammaproteobacteria bacterium]